MPTRIHRAFLLATAVLLATPHLHAQASALPTAQTGDAPGASDRGRKILDQAIAALGGDKWLNRSTWTVEGKTSTFYKGAPHPEIVGFEEYYRAQPFGERVIIATESPRILAQMVGIPAVKMERDTALVYTPTDAFAVDYKGKTELPKEELDNYLLRQKYTLDAIIKQWANEPGTIITYEGTQMVERRLAERISILTPENQSATLDLQEDTHLPLTRTVQYRDPLYKDRDTDIEQYDNYQTFSGIATPMTITRLHNGDIVSQRFVTRVQYNVPLADDLFNPDRPIQKKVKK